MIKSIINNYNRVFVVGDLHGQIHLLNGKLLEVDFDKEKDLLLSVGDLIDRGEDSLACLRLLKEPWFKAVRGNHEQLAIDAINGGSEYLWTVNGGSWFLALDQKHRDEAEGLIALADTLPYIIEINISGKRIRIAHAAFPTKELSKGRFKNYVLWDRTQIARGATYPDEVEDTPRADLYIFGHTPLTNMEQHANRLYIDTGAVFSGNLAMVELTNIKI